MPGTGRVVVDVGSGAAICAPAAACGFFNRPRNAGIMEKLPQD